jgi:hypothetical protein
MLHATENTLAKFSALLASLRAIEGLNEKRPGVFYRKSKAFVHFHEDPTGLFADLRVNVDEGFVRIRVESKVEQSTFIKTITSALTHDGLPAGGSRKIMPLPSRSSKVANRPQG